MPYIDLSPFRGMDFFVFCAEATPKLLNFTIKLTEVPQFIFCQQLKKIF